MNKTTLKIISALYVFIWMIMMTFIVIDTIQPVRSIDTQSEIPVLDKSTLFKINTQLHNRQPAPLSEPFDYTQIEFGKTEPFD